MVVQRLNTDVMVFTRIGSKIEIYFYKYAFFSGSRRVQHRRRIIKTFNVMDVINKACFKRDPEDSKLMSRM